MEAALKREEEEREERRRKKKRKKEEKLPEMTQKKEAIEKGAVESMAFGEAKPILEVKFVKTQIPDMAEGIEKYEPVVKEELAVKLVQEEKKRQKLQKEKEKSEKIVKKEKTIPKSKLRERKKIHTAKVQKLLEEARTKGMKDPIVDVASQLVKQEIKKGSSNKLAIRKVVLLLGKMKIINKKNVDRVFKALKKLFG